MIIMGHICERIGAAIKNYSERTSAAAKEVHGLGAEVIRNAVERLYVLGNVKAPLPGKTWVWKLRLALTHPGLTVRTALVNISEEDWKTLGTVEIRTDRPKENNLTKEVQTLIEQAGGWVTPAMQENPRPAKVATHANRVQPRMGAQGSRGMELDEGEDGEAVQYEKETEKTLPEVAPHNQGLDYRDRERSRTRDRDLPKATRNSQAAAKRAASARRQ